MSTDRRRGFILPTTLMVMTLLTVMLTAAFILVAAESRTTDNSLAMGRAHALAQAGLQTYLTLNRGISPGTNSDSVRLTFPAGYADVIGSRLVAPGPTGVALWLVRSTGVLTGSTLTGLTTARRSVAQLASFNPGSLPLRGVFVSAHPVAVIDFFGFGGLSDPVSGVDACGVSAPKRELTIANGTLTGSLGGITPDYLASAAAVLDSTHIDWASLLAGNFTPDYIAPSWPSFSGYPIGYAPGNLTLPGGTRVGILVVQGDLTINDLSHWGGIIIVGGHVRTTSNFPINVQVRGAVISGLNNLITPGSVGLDTLYRGWGTSFQWNSCEAGWAAGAMASMSPMSNGYIDTWANY